MGNFVNLHIHTQYSLFEGAIHIKNLASKLKSLDQKACAITDHGNLFGAIQFYKSLKKENIKPIIGQGFNMVSINKNNKNLYKINLICQNKEGYHNLIKLSSQSYFENSQNPQINFQLLAKYNKGLIAIIIGHESEFAHLDHSPEINEFHDFFIENYSNRYYLEVYPTAKSITPKELNLIALAKKFNIKCFFSNCAYYLNQKMAYPQYILKQMGQHEKLPENFNPSSLLDVYYLKSFDEINASYPELPIDLLEESVKIADSCELDLENKNYYLPEFKAPDNQNLHDYFIAEASKGLDERLAFLSELYNWGDKAQEKFESYKKRLDYELDVITKMGYQGYFMIVADFVNFAKQNKILVGPGRGSGAGSLAAYALKITDLDPVEYDLLFERFLNPDRISMPDFDIDFEAFGRDRVIEYVREKYGKEKVAQISALGSLKPRAVVKGVGRVMGAKYSDVEAIAKMIPFELDITLATAFEKSPELKALRDSDGIESEIIDIALSLEGLNSNLSTHASGVVIMDTNIVERLPVCLSSDSNSIQTQYPMEDIEHQGAVKFDFLGLRNLTIIEECLSLIAKNKKEVPDISKLPLNDPKPYSLISAGFNIGIFQLESSGIHNYLKQFQPKSLSEIIALVGIYRPGPLQSGMAMDFIERKNGRSTVEYLHPKLEPILKETFGVIIYQEQVMRIAQVLADFSLSQADLLRRAMGKKKPKELEMMKNNFITGCAKNKIGLKTANEIFELISKFAGYGFNKSHSAAYGLICFQTAYLKCYYPAEYISALLTYAGTKQEKIGEIIGEAIKLGIKILKPEINLSNLHHLPTADNDIVYGFITVKSLGQGAAESIIEERNKNGAFKNLTDFFNRLDTKIVNNKSVEALIYGGVLDSFEPNRGLLLANYSSILNQIAEVKTQKSKLKNSLFGESLANESTNKPIEYKNKNIAFHLSNYYKEEINFLGFHFSAGPIDYYASEINALEKFCTDFSEINTDKLKNNAEIYLTGQIKNLKIRYQASKGANNKYMATFDINNKSGSTKIVVFEPEINSYRLILEDDSTYLLVCKTRLRNNDLMLQATTIIPLAELRNKICKELIIKIDYNEMTKIDRLKNLLSDNSGSTKIFVKLNINKDNKAMTALYDIGLNCTLSNEFSNRINDQFDHKKIEYVYSGLNSDIFKLDKKTDK